MTTQKTPEEIASELVEEACKKGFLYKSDMDQVCVEDLIAAAIRADRMERDRVFSEEELKQEALRRVKELKEKIKGL